MSRDPPHGGVLPVRERAAAGGGSALALLLLAALLALLALALLMAVHGLASASLLSAPPPGGPLPSGGSSPSVLAGSDGGPASSPTLGLSLSVPSTVGAISLEAAAAGLVAAGVVRFATWPGRPIAIPVLVAIKARRNRRLALEGLVLVEGLREYADELAEEFGGFDPTQPPDEGWGG